MALLPADPRQRKQMLVLMGVLILLMWFLGWQYVVSPRNEGIDTAQQQLDRLETQNRRSRALAARRDDLDARLEEQERLLRVFEELIPESEEVPNLLDAISQEAQLTGVEFSRIRPQAAVAGEFYTKQTWEITILGEYHDVGRYMARIASLPRIIKPTSVQLSLAQSNRATRDMEAALEASFRIETFVLGATPGSRPAAAGSRQGASSGD